MIVTIDIQINKIKNGFLLNYNHEKMPEYYENSESIIKAIKLKLNIDLNESDNE